MWWLPQCCKVWQHSLAMLQFDYSATVCKPAEFFHYGDCSIANANVASLGSTPLPVEFNNPGLYISYSKTNVKIACGWIVKVTDSDAKMPRLYSCCFSPYWNVKYILIIWCLYNGPEEIRTWQSLSVKWNMASISVKCVNYGPPPSHTFPTQQWCTGQCADHQMLCFNK